MSASAVGILICFLFHVFMRLFLLEMKAIGSFSKSWQIDDSWFFTAL